MAHVRLFRHYIHTPYLLMSALEAVLVAGAAYLGYYTRFQEWPEIVNYLAPASSFGVILVVAMFAMEIGRASCRERV